MDTIEELHFSTTSNPDEILPEKALAVIPFWASPINAWDKSCDLNTFLTSLLEGTGYQDTADHYFEEALARGEFYAEQFRTYASNVMPAPGSMTQEVVIPDFEADPLFGRVIKAVTAWDAAVENILSEAGYSSLPHLLETRSDLRCSVELASSLFYRQSLQVLRGFIESVILPIHLSKNPTAFSQWKDKDYRTPSIGGEKGIVRRLQKEGVIGEQLARKISDTYSLLNHYIHGSEATLNNTGLSEGTWQGHVFQYARFQTWAEVLILLVEVSLPLLKINLVQWAAVKADRDLFCSICHGTSLTVVREKPDLGLTKYECGQCTHSFWKDEKEDGSILTTVTFTGA